MKFHFHFPRNIGISPLGSFSWDATRNKHLPLRKIGSIKETVGARDEQKREDESRLKEHQARRERGFDGLIKADGCTNREGIDHL